MSEPTEEPGNEHLEDDASEVAPEWPDDPAYGLGDDGDAAYAYASPAAPRARPALGLFLAVALVAGVLGGGAGALIARVGERGSVVVQRVTTPASTVADQNLTGVAGVAKRVMPSIVRIDVTSGATPFGGSTGGTGSGVILTNDGYIITNNHVVEGAQTISVTLSDGRQLPARLIGTAAPIDDIAVVKVNKSGLTAATIGSTSSLSVGDVAVAIGSPFGLQGSVTAGVISALHRNIDLGSEHLTDALQTDAPINPGNSGGALSDAAGDVVGINTAILGSTGGNVGVGFAIPIDIAQRDAQQIIKTGHAERPLLGITGQNSPNADGALIEQTVAGGPAAKAGLKSGDRIVALDGKTIRSMDELIAALSAHSPGDTVTLTYVRGGATKTARATLTTRTS